MIWTVDHDDFAEALAAARDGDQRGFTALWSEFAPRVAGFLRGRGEPDADDLTSQVFLDAFRAVDRFDGDHRAFGAFLLTIARRRAVDAHRSRRRRVQECAGWEAELDDRSAPSPEEVVLAGAGRQWVVDLLDTLSADQREVLLLRVIGDLTIDAVAAEVGKTQGAVKALQRRGLETLRRGMLRATPGLGDGHLGEAR